jgi:hypothetical protein
MPYALRIALIVTDAAHREEPAHLLRLLHHVNKFTSRPRGL